jgi:hypothetical protein
MATKKLRVWWIPQVPGKPFHVEVESITEAKKLLDTLAKYDLFQLAHKIKPDYCNAGGLEVNVKRAWEEWESLNGEGIGDLTLEDCQSIDAGRR